MPIKTWLGIVAYLVTILSLLAVSVLGFFLPDAKIWIGVSFATLISGMLGITTYHWIEAFKK